MTDSDEPSVQLVEESVSVDKTRVTTGRVRVSTSTALVEERAQAVLSGARVEVTRVPVGREIDEVPSVRIDGDTTIIPVVEEVVIVEKRLVLVEEVHVTQILSSEEVSVPVTLRKQTATVEHLDE